MSTVYRETHWPALITYEIAWASRRRLHRPLLPIEHRIDTLDWRKGTNLACAEQLNSEPNVRGQWVEFKLESNNICGGGRCEAWTDLSARRRVALMATRDPAFIAV